jgi:hypothetical protein
MHRNCHTAQHRVVRVREPEAGGEAVGRDDALLSGHGIGGEVVVDDVELLRGVLQEVAVPDGVVCNIIPHCDLVGVVEREAALVVVVEGVVLHQAVHNGVVGVVEVQRWACV